MKVTLLKPDYFHASLKSKGVRRGFEGPLHQASESGFTFLVTFIQVQITFLGTTWEFSVANYERKNRTPR